MAPTLQNVGVLGAVNRPENELTSSHAKFLEDSAAPLGHAAVLQGNVVHHIAR